MKKFSKNHKFFAFVIVNLLLTIVLDVYSQQLISVSPNKGAQGKTSLMVEIVGSQTQFQSTGTINKTWLNKGGNTINMNTSVLSNTTLQSVFSVPCSADSGLWDLYYTNVNSTDTLVLNKSFQINPSGLDSINPTQGCLGNNVALSLNSFCGAFGQSSSTINSGWINDGNNTLNFTNVGVQSNNEVTASLYIPHSATQGSYNIALTDGIDTFQLDNAFLVTHLLIDSVYPNEACNGENLIVNITGSCAVFGSSTGSINKAWLNKGASDITLTSVVVSNSNLITANLDVPANATAGLWDIYYVQGVDTGYLKDAFTIKYCVGVSAESDIEKSTAPVLKIYPNPLKSNQQLVVEVVNTSNIDNILVYDIQGNKILQKENISEPTTTMSLANLANGIYIVQVITDNQILTTRFYLQ